MKRRNYIVVMMMGLLLGSCSSEDILSVPNGNGRIRFDVGVSQSEEVTVTPMNGSTTRSAEPLFLPTSSIEMHSGDMKMYANCASSADIPMHNIVPETTTRGSIKTEADFYPDFGLFGYFYDNLISWNESSFSPQLSINKAKATNNNGNWTTNVYWPGASKKATFFAYAPYNANVTLESETGTPKMTFTVPTEIDNQQDLLVAKSEPDISCGGNTEVALNFKHVLSAIKFVKGETPGFSAIKQIQISGVKNQGTLNMDSQSWESADGSATYTISTIDENTVCFLMPQTVPSGAKLSVTFSNGATEQTYEADIENTTWAAGYQYTYSLSINKITGEFIFEVNGPSESVSADGGTANFTVKSYYQYDDGIITVPIPWSCSYTDDGITNTLNGDGSVEGEDKLITIGENTNTIDHTEFLKSNDSKGTTDNPFNLADPTRTGSDQNTANCYVVSAPGVYKLPLVYGNGITNGVAANNGEDAVNNKFAYNQSINFMNHNGVAIYSLPKAPYITGNGYDPNIGTDGAKIVWTSSENLITNAQISSDGHYLVFTVDQSTIQQGNAVVAAVYNNTIVWSWHIWVTETPLSTYTYGDYKFLNMPLGFVDSSTIPRNINVSFSQSMGNATRSWTIAQAGDAASVGTALFYQWGRKDPFMKSGNEIGSGPVNQSEAIKNPNTFYTGDDWSSKQDNKGYDYWNVGNASISTSKAVTKSIYDPSPVGYKIPPCIAFNSLGIPSQVNGKGYLNTSNNDFWQKFGRLANVNGLLNDQDTGYYWSASPNKSNFGYKLHFSPYGIGTQGIYRRANGFSVRPVSE